MRIKEYQITMNLGFISEDILIVIQYFSRSHCSSLILVLVLTNFEIFITKTDSYGNIKKNS